MAVNERSSRSSSRRRRRTWLSTIRELSPARAQLRLPAGLLCSAVFRVLQNTAERSKRGTQNAAERRRPERSRTQNAAERSPPGTQQNATVLCCNAAEHRTQRNATPLEHSSTRPCSDGTQQNTSCSAVFVFCCVRVLARFWFHNPGPEAPPFLQKFTK